MGKGSGKGAGKGAGKGKGAGGGRKEETKQALDDERKEREAKRASKRADKLKNVEGLDALELAQKEMGKGGAKGEPASMEEAAAAEEQAADEELDMAFKSKKAGKTTADDSRGALAGDDGGANKLTLCVEWLFEKPKQPLNEWQTYRRQEMEDYIKEMRRGLMSYMPKFYDTLMVKSITRTKMRYWGEYDGKGMRDGRGICFWPDPPHGGGETYHGLWRNDQPNGHGLFRWYDGDMYMGEWNVGDMQGYGVYKYGPTGQFAKDMYEGTYFNGLRQGTGVYKYAAKEETGAGAAVYLGEWLRGMMHGNGLLIYADGETYQGQWKLDKKDGFGQYTWGANAGEVAGDRYQGEFVQGFTHGLGKTIFADGGSHRGRYSKGKLNGYGVLKVSDGWEYTGTWKDDELHGEVVCYYSFGTGLGKEVQVYEHGEYVRSREYDPQTDWGDIESMGMSEARSADKAAEGGGRTPSSLVENLHG